MANALVEPIKARRKILLTGTPIVNRPSELFPLINYLDGERWGNFVGYAKRYCDAYQDRYGWHFDGANEARLPELQETLRGSIMVRRLKSDVLKDMPAKMRSTVVVPPTKEMEGLIKEESRYDADLDEMVDETGEFKVAFNEMARVRHDLAMAKVPFVVDHIEAMMQETDKIVVMAHHHDVQDAICEAIGPAAVLHRGGLSDAQKQEAVDGFQTNPEIKVFVGSIKASGVGITLTAAHHVVFAELDWVPGNISQAEDRCHRIGQKDTVWVQHLVVDGSLDATMAERIIEKQRIMDKAIDIKVELPTVVEPEPKPQPKPQAQNSYQIGKYTLVLTDEQLEAAVKALHILAGNDPDMAREQNGIGFNKIDGPIGHDLANRSYLSNKQKALAWKIVRKYQGQLGESLTKALLG